MGTGTRLPFIDWLKAIGITLILLGHLAGGYTNNLTPPIYPKQLGVAFFIFAMGYSLAMETRPRAEVVFNRLFELMLWGVTIAIIVTLRAYVTQGSLAASNLLPFLFGVNVLMDHFPANPTTWYIGTYIHLLALWCVARGIRLSLPLMTAILVFEIGSRSILAQAAGLHIAYMVVPNWLTVFAAVAAGLLWYYAVWPLVAERTVPFMLMAAPTRTVGFLATSCLVSVLYVGWTGVAYLTFRTYPAPQWVRFLAENTLIVFIAHMPVFYWLDPLLESAGWSYLGRSTIELVVCLPGLAMVSAILHRALPLRQWRWSVSQRLFTSAHPHALPH